VHISPSNSDGEVADSGRSYPPARRAWAMVAILMVANIFSFVDRQIVALLIDPIKRDIHIDDIQVSLLIGPTFALFFAALALPIGRMVDSVHRVRLAAAGVALWSMMTVLSGYANAFAVLFIARIGVAVGEAVLFPAANSLIADSFSPANRARPIGAYATAIYLGSGLAFVFGGAIIGLVGHGGLPNLPLLSGRTTWQLVLIFVGAPGLLVALGLLVVREPKRRDMVLAHSGATTLPVRAVLSYVRQRLKPFLFHSLSFSMFVVASYALSSWVPTHLTRTLGMARSEAGVWYGIAVMVAGITGITTATSYADRLNARGVLDGKFRIGAVISLVGGILAVASMWVTNPYVFIMTMGGVVMAISAGVGLGPAALQEIAPNELRGQSLAGYQLIATVLGAGLGPTMVAVLTQAVFRNPNSVGTSIGIVAGISLLAGAIAFWIGRRHFLAEVEARRAALGEAIPGRISTV
jgi:MFS family permease